MAIGCWSIQLSYSGALTMAATTDPAFENHAAGRGIARLG